MELVTLASAALQDPARSFAATREGVLTIRIAAIYGSKYGHTEQVVRRISDVLERDGHTVTITRGDRLPRDIALDGFD